jgi:NAD(P)-dependent dehydrogenase (short-subunit alcohol dehydrogenase family)
MFQYKSFTKTHHRSSYDAISPKDPAHSVRGKIILITGGGGGIGRAISSAFVEAGAAAIMLIGRTETSLKQAQAALSETTLTTISYACADTTDAIDIERVFSAALKQYGKIDVLVNNAGYMDEHRALADAGLNDYWHSFEVNVKGPVVTTQAFLKVARSGATVINISSSAAVMPFMPTVSAYSASKLATAKIMECIHHENPNLRIFNVQPGLIKTDMAKSAGITSAEFDDPGMGNDKPVIRCLLINKVYRVLSVFGLRVRRQSLSEAGSCSLTGMSSS